MEANNKIKVETFHFRIETMAFLNEIVDNALVKNHGILKTPLNVLRVLLGQVAQRCAEINDPVLNRLMFDMALYELPRPTDPEYNKIMKKLYAAEKKFLKSKSK